jgi:pre-rRNA-processing protein TSR1
MIFTLLPYERKVSTVNFMVHRNTEYDEPVKSKDPVILMSGFRRLIVNPIYSTYSRGGTNNVHKFERFLQKGRTCVGTFYGPIQFGPAPILMFKYDENGYSWTAGTFIKFLAI